MKAIAACAAVLMLAACKPPPTDAGLAGEVPEAEPTYASAPLDSPRTKGAVWVDGGERERIVYGIPGGAALMALHCEGTGPNARITLTRMAPADEGAGALMAMVGNGHFGRVEVDAAKVSTGAGGRFLWEGTVPADHPALEPLRGPREVQVTVPGAGTLVLNPSPRPMQLLARCQSAGRARPEDQG